MTKLTLRVDDKFDTYLTEKAKILKMSKANFIRSLLTKKITTINDIGIQKQLENIISEIDDLNKAVHDNTNKTLLGNQLICQLLMSKYTSEELTNLVAKLQTGLGIKEEANNE